MSKATQFQEIARRIDLQGRPLAQQLSVCSGKQFFISCRNLVRSTIPGKNFTKCTSLYKGTFLPLPVANS
jgi:hypothetical protein